MSSGFEFKIALLIGNQYVLYPIIFSVGLPINPNSFITRFYLKFEGADTLPTSTTLPSR
jgi:hypothetical protein